MKNQADLFKTLDLGLLTTIVGVSGAGTLVMSLVGFFGAWFKNPTVLKGVSRLNTNCL